MFTITLPDVVFKTRVKTDDMPGFDWKDVTTRDLFANKRVVLFSLPGAFTPTCSSTHLPGYEANYSAIRDLGIDEVYCLSVNDSFSMNAWFNGLGIQNVKAIPDGNADFTRLMGFLVEKRNLGFGPRSWRYSMVVTNGTVEMMFVEPGQTDNADGDPFEISDVDTMIRYLQAAMERQEKKQSAAKDA